jgi:drug/metabolite transporter (DMT)-like permease
MAVRQTTAPFAATTLPGKNVLLAFLLFILFGGGASVAIRTAYQELDPFWTAAARFGFGAVVFWVIAYIKKIPLPKGKSLLGALLYGLLGVGLGFLFIAWGLVKTPASLYQILMAMVPLATMFLSASQGIEAITRRGVIGSLLAVVGIVITVGGSGSKGFSLPHVIAIIIAAVLIAESSVIIKRFPPNPPVMTNAISMSVGSLVLGAASLINGETWALPTQVATWIAFLYILIIVSVIGLFLYMFVLGNWTASGSSYGFVIVPIVTMTVAALIAGEKITINFIIGAVFVLAGVLVGALLPDKSKSEAQMVCKDSTGQALPRCL